MLGYVRWTKETEFCSGFGERVLVSVCPAAWKALRWLTGSKWIQGWKSLPSPSCQFWFGRDEEGLKLPSSFWWWMRSESVISAYFLLVCLPISPLASATNDTNRVFYRKLPAQGNKGNGPWTLKYPLSAGVFFEASCNAACRICWYCSRRLSFCRQKLWLQSCSAGISHQHCFLLCFLGRRRIKLQVSVILTLEIFRTLCACAGSCIITKIFCSLLEDWLPHSICFSRSHSLSPLPFFFFFLNFVWPLHALRAHIVQMIIVCAQPGH